MNLQKHIPFRSRKLLDLAHRIQECTMQLPGCKGWVEHGCEPAHSDQGRHGKGGSQKSGDQYHAAICHHCHTKLPKLEREDRDYKWQLAHEKTFHIYWTNGWIKVN